MLKQRSVFCHSQAGPSWHVAISQLTITIAKNLSGAEGLKEASLINAITQTCLSHVSYLIPSQEERHSSGHCLCLSERDIQVPQGILLESRVALLCPGWQLILGFSYSSRIQSIFLPGSDFIAGRALAAIQTSQAAFAAGCGSLPACPWHCVCPQRCLCSVVRSIFRMFLQLGLTQWPFAASGVYLDTKKLTRVNPGTGCSRSLVRAVLNHTFDVFCSLLLLSEFSVSAFHRNRAHDEENVLQALPDLLAIIPGRT